MVMCFASCEKNNGNELSGDDVIIIIFEDANFLQALLRIQEMRIYDTDGYYYTYLMDVDRNRDRQISVNEAQNVLGIDVSNVNIFKMPEIKYFTGLINLQCGDNQLTSLDVSNNTKLTELDCRSNQLTSLDVSNNTELTSLDCGDNQLTSLDVSNNTELTELSCRANQLTSLDVSNNTELTELSCRANQLTSLDVSNNTELTCLLCSNNPLTKIILNKNNKLDESSMNSIMEEYGNIIEYVE